MLGEVLSAEGELARRKVFSRRHLMVELAPHLFGQDPPTLDLLVDRALQDPEVIPLVGVAGAREQPHALASVLATETGHRRRHRPPAGPHRRPRRPLCRGWRRRSGVAEKSDRRRPVRRAAPGRREHL